MADAVRAVCVFCASSTGNGAVWSTAARELGTELVRRRLRLVYGGSRQGLMGVLANTVLESGGVAVGVMPRGLVAREAAHRGLTELHVVDTMAERKAMMAKLADAFVALPGGYGTLDELGEMLTARQLELHHKPVGLLNVDGYYDALIAFLDHATDVGFIRPESRSRLLVDTASARLLDTMGAQVRVAPAA